MESLEEKKSKIQSLEDEISILQEKKRQLKKLKDSYFYDYFNLKREDYAILSDMPDNCTGTTHILFPHSILNVDEVGNMICELFKKYENKDMIAQRSVVKDVYSTYPIHSPILVIGKKGYGDSLVRSKGDIVIPFEKCANLKLFPTDNPVSWRGYDCVGEYKPKQLSNYRIFLAKKNGVCFDIKGHKFIEELIFSLAYYQKEHGIEQMDAKESREVFKKMYKL